MEHPFSRLELLVGDEGLHVLNHAHVLVFGLGGVGSWAAETLIRSGIGHVGLVDYDAIKLSNINRQLPATHSTVGRLKTDVMREHLLDVNPQADILCVPTRVTPDNLPSVLAAFPDCDYIIDAIDEKLAKRELILTALRENRPIISSMGAANKLSAADIQVADISESHGCPLARGIRKFLRQNDIESGLQVVYSPELPVRLQNGAFKGDDPDALPGEKGPMGTIAYVPMLMGIRCAAEVVRHLLEKQEFRHRGGE